MDGVSSVRVKVENVSQAERLSSVIQGVCPRRWVEGVACLSHCRPSIVGALAERVINGGPSAASQHVLTAARMMTNDAGKMSKLKPFASTRPASSVLRRLIAGNGPFIITPMTLEQLQDSMTRAMRAYKVRA